MICRCSSDDGVERPLGQAFARSVVDEGHHDDGAIHPGWGQLHQRLVDERVACVGAVKGLVGAASAAAMQRHTAREVELTGGFWVFFGDLDADLSGLARSSLDLLEDDSQSPVHFVKRLLPQLDPQIVVAGVD